MKPRNETTEEVKWEFLLVMTPENLTSTSYEDLASGEFDANTMNKFATNPEEDSPNLFEFIEENPTGYEETTANSPLAKRPIFGTVSSNETICTSQPEYDPGSGGCIVRCKEVKHTTTYIFWIGFPKPDQILSSWTNPVPC